MMRIILLLLAGLFVVTNLAQAGTNDNAKIAGHLVPHNAKGSPCDSPPLPPCNNGDSVLVVQGDVGVGYDLYILVLDGNPVAGIGGAVFGIAYDSAPQSGMDALGWTLCADLEFPHGAPGISWPDSGSGNLITWDQTQNCQTTWAVGDLDGGVTAAMGALYVYAYSEDRFSITRREYVPSPDLGVVDCASNVSPIVYPDHTGAVTFGEQPGYDPCWAAGQTGEDRVPATPSWSSGFDPTQVPIQWPLTIRLDSNKAIVVNNSYLGPGATISFSYDSSTTSLFLNGELWCSYEPKPAASPISPEEVTSRAWIRELKQRSLAQPDDLPEERLAKALAEMDKSMLDPNFPPEVSASQVVLKFKEKDEVAIILMNSPSRADDFEEAAMAEVRTALMGLTGPRPFVLVHYPQREYALGGTSATELQAVLSRAVAGHLSEEDRTFADRNNVLEAVQAIAEGNQ